MVSLDQDRHFTSLTQPAWPAVNLSLIGAVAAATALLAITADAYHGFDEIGLQAGAQWAWRFTSIAFLVAMLAGPLGRLFPVAPFKILSAQKRDLLLAFCVGGTVYLTALVIPASLRHEPLAVETILFVLLSAVGLAFIATAASPHLMNLNVRTQRRLLSGAFLYFWLCYSFGALYHLYGPHRPDAYYGLCLSLMIVALLVRFADHFVLMLKGTVPVEAD